MNRTVSLTTSFSDLLEPAFTTTVRRLRFPGERDERQLPACYAPPPPPPTTLLPRPLYDARSELDEIDELDAIEEGEDIFLTEAEAEALAKGTIPPRLAALR
ncbi:MAG: hypothetical protein HOO96_21300 [Polyangiaceae bacterium]|nr:hypothetical protein [Polyangiaceae bacterium]